MERTASAVTIPKAPQVKIELSRKRAKKRTELMQFNLKSNFRSHYFTCALVIAIGIDVKHICLLKC